MIMTSLRAAFAVLACACMLAACDDAPAEKPQGSSAADKKPTPSKTADVASDMVAAVSAGKVASAIGVHFALRATPVANMPLPVDVAIVPHRKFSLVRVSFETHDGLSTTSGDEFGPANNVDGETALLHKLLLLPSKEGMFMVTATVETDGDDGNVTRVFYIPVIVAAVAPTPADAPAAAAAGNPAGAPPGN